MSLKRHRNGLSLADSLDGLPLIYLIKGISCPIEHRVSGVPAGFLAYFLSSYSSRGLGIRFTGKGERQIRIYSRVIKYSQTNEFVEFVSNTCNFIN